MSFTKYSLCTGAGAWKIPWTEEPGGLQSMGSLRVRHDWATSLSLFTFMHWRRKWQPTPVFLPGEWRIPGTGEPGGLPSMGSHRVGHDWSDLAAAAAAAGAGAGGMRMNKMWPPLLQFCLFKKKSSLLSVSRLTNILMGRTLARMSIKWLIFHIEADWGVDNAHCHDNLLCITASFQNY